MPAIDVVEMFLEELGRLPASFKQLARYAADKRVSLADPEGSRLLAPIFPLLRERRLPKWTPEAPPEPGEPVPPWHVEPLVDPLVAPRNRQGAWTLASCIESLIKAADEIEVLAPGTKLTQATYRRHQKAGATSRRQLGSQPSPRSAERPSASCENRSCAGELAFGRLSRRSSSPPGAWTRR